MSEVQIAKILLSPTVTLETLMSANKTERSIEMPHEKCLVRNAL